MAGDTTYFVYIFPEETRDVIRLLAEDFETKEGAAKEALRLRKEDPNIAPRVGSMYVMS